MTDRKPSPMRARSRFLAAAGAPLLIIVTMLFALGGIASAHVVTAITADCYRVTVQFSDFPERGVMVHIAAQVNSQALISTDVLVTSETPETQLDISAATTTLYGAPAQIDVDVRWSYQGPQHAHKTLTETCGSATTTTEASTTTVTEASTTTGAETTTSLQVLGSTTIVPATTSPPATTPETVGGQGSPAPTTTTAMAAPGNVELPRTGSNPAFPVMFGLSALVAGALLIARSRASLHEQGLE